MEIKTLVCDIDGTLMKSGGGLYVSSAICNQLIQLQQKGITLILASARIFQGVLPLAKQLQMDQYGGFIISSNGAYAYDVKQKESLFCKQIAIEDSLHFWKVAASMGLEVAIAQPSWMIASGYTRGFELDHFNCGIDYVITDTPEVYLKAVITKCAASQSKENIDRVYEAFKQTIETKMDCAVVRSTPLYIDLVRSGCDKVHALEELFAMEGLSFATCAAIGDGGSDAGMIDRAALGATLKNAHSSCLEAADIICDSVEQEGCRQFFTRLFDMKKGM